MKILGIETSCDETAVSLLQVTRDKIQVTSNVVLSQIEIHKKYGGIVPEVAARKHVESIIPIIEEALNDDSISKTKDLRPDLIAVTYGPGLITSLQVGIQTAKTLSYIWDVPLVGVNHLEAHLWSFLLNKEQRTKIEDLKFPAVGLVISGGHTEMILVKGIGSPRFGEAGKYKLIGRTRDDAVGEAFDKVAKMLNLGYPGGPIISHYAKSGNPKKIDFPRPMIDSKDFDFSFSGIKTSVKYFLKELISTGSLSSHLTKDICASFQQAVIDVLVEKTVRAAKEFKVKSIILGGGVSANEELIKELGTRCKEQGLNFYYPYLEHTGDNAAMIALTGYFNIKKSSKKCWQKLTADANLKIV